ncbi:hypothetical protein D3C80_2173640 [compost metagenome]
MAITIFPLFQLGKFLDQRFGGDFTAKGMRGKHSVSGVHLIGQQVDGVVQGGYQGIDVFPRVVWRKGGA